MTEWERQLRSWKPRRPSARLKERLFATPITDPPSPLADRHTPAFHLSWLAPATAALLLVAALVNQHNSGAVFESPRSASMVAMILSNQSAAAYLPATFQSEQNGLPPGTFEWTNGSRSASSNRSLPVWSRKN